MKRLILHEFFRDMPCNRVPTSFPAMRHRWDEDYHVLDESSNMSSWRHVSYSCVSCPAAPLPLKYPVWLITPLAYTQAAKDTAAPSPASPRNSAFDLTLSLAVVLPASRRVAAMVVNCPPRPPTRSHPTCRAASVPPSDPRPAVCPAASPGSRTASRSTGRCTTSGCRSSPTEARWSSPHPAMRTSVSADRSPAEPELIRAQARATGDPPPYVSH